MMLSHSTVQTSGFIVIMHIVCVFQSVRLSRLDVCNVSLVDYPARSLSKALLTSRLSVLHLHNAQLSGTPLFTLGTAQSMHTGSQHIYVCGLCVYMRGVCLLLCVCSEASRTRF